MEGFAQDNHNNENIEALRSRQNMYQFQEESHFYINILAEQMQQNEEGWINLNDNQDTSHGYQDYFQTNESNTNSHYEENKGQNSQTIEAQSTPLQQTLEQDGSCCISGTTNSVSMEIKKGRWSDEEHERFLEALRLHGKDWELIEKHVGTRKVPNIRAHGQKFLEKLVKLLESDDLQMDGEELQQNYNYRKLLEKKIHKSDKFKKQKIQEQMNQQMDIQQEEPQDIFIKFDQIPNQHPLNQEQIQQCGMSMDQFLLDRQDNFEDDDGVALSKDTKQLSNSDIVGFVKQNSFGSSASILQRKTTLISETAMSKWVNQQATSSHKTSLRIRSIYSRKQSLKSNGGDIVSEKKFACVNFFQELMQYNDGSGSSGQLQDNGGRGSFDMMQAERNNSGRHQTVLQGKMQLSTYDNDEEMRLRSDAGSVVSNSTIIDRIVDDRQNSDRLNSFKNFPQQYQNQDDDDQEMDTS